MKSFEKYLLESSCTSRGVEDAQIMINLTDGMDNKYTLWIGENSSLLLGGGHNIKRGVCYSITELQLPGKTLIQKIQVEELVYNSSKELRKEVINLFKKSVMTVNNIKDLRK